jgi:Protein of unknown function (DUF1566)
VRHDTVGGDGACTALRQQRRRHLERYDHRADVELKTTDSGVHDMNRTYNWSGTGARADGTAFTDFLGTLNFGLLSNPPGATVTNCFANHCDWRLPTIEELRGILEPGAPGCPRPGSEPTGFAEACIDPRFGPTKAGYYWSATTDAGSSSHAWLVNFSNGLGIPGAGTKIFGVHVRAVRNGM